MIKLHGARISNHFNKVKVALLEKAVAFEEAPAMPSQERAFLEFSPMGKIPVLEVDGRFLCESQAINEYLEEAHPSPALMPKDPWQRAKVREATHILELYVLYPSFRLLGHVFFGAPLSAETKAEVQAALERGAPAFARVTKFDPYLAGAALSLADCAAFFHLPLITALSSAVYGKDALGTVPGVAAYLERLKQRPAFGKAAAEQQAALAAFMAKK